MIVGQVFGSSNEERVDDNETEFHPGHGTLRPQEDAIGDVMRRRFPG